MQIVSVVAPKGRLELHDWWIVSPENFGDAFGRGPKPFLFIRGLQQFVGMHRYLLLAGVSLFTVPRGQLERAWSTNEATPTATLEGVHSAGPEVQSPMSLAST